MQRTEYSSSRRLCFTYSSNVSHCTHFVCFFSLFPLPNLHLPFPMNSCLPPSAFSPTRTQPVVLSQTYTLSPSPSISLVHPSYFNSSPNITSLYSHIPWIQDENTPSQNICILLQRSYLSMLFKQHYQLYVFFRRRIQEYFSSLNSICEGYRLNGGVTPTDGCSTEQY